MQLRYLLEMLNVAITIMLDAIRKHTKYRQILSQRVPVLSNHRLMKRRACDDNAVERLRVVHKSGRKK